MQSETASVADSLVQSVDALTQMEGQVQQLSKAQDSLSTLQALQLRLDETEAASGEIDAGLTQLREVSARQNESMNDISEVTRHIATNLELVSGPLHSMITSAQQINQHSLQALIDFYKLSQGESDALASMEANLQLVYRGTSAMTSAMFNVDQSDNTRSLLVDLRRDLRPLRGQTRQYAQMDMSLERRVLGREIVTAVEKMIELSIQIQAGSLELANRTAAEANTLAQQTQAATADQIAASKTSAEVLDNALRLINQSNEGTRSVISDLTSSVEQLTLSLQSIPEVERQIETSLNAVQRAVASDQVERMDEAGNRALQAQKNAQTIPIVLLVFILIAFAISAVVAFYLQRLIVKPLANFVSGVRRVTDNDLRTRVTDEGAIGELKAVIGSVNEMIEGLRQNVLDMTQSGKNISESARLMANTSTKTRDALEQQKQGEQAIVDSTDALADMVRQVANSGSEAGERAREADEVIKQSQQDIENAKREMASLANTVSRSNEVIQSLKLQSDNIGQVISVIQNVSGQTNLLALNAAIEAARAGEHGRGFAVVADEVRQLAQRTSEATIEIRDLIEQIQAGSDQGVESMTEGLAQVARNTQATESVALSLESVIDQVATISRLNLEIGEHTRQQLQQLDSIEAGVESVRRQSEQASEAVLDNVSASENLNRTASTLGDLVKRFSI
ncbi:methyl-accepting chemotaxis protein [Nitrincola sp. A-D6]|uniref:methyl-accepting chemotaxis protein n=1 Tax=Nitrincola sp. A-D6 TaxID=1545442 RepID=UPI0011855D49|nr:methyl-accepting chemotaxis protein [Nitrincola sp. A-D6]